ncbi:hypothetical protein FXF46_10880 [Gluconobacter thailandicus]|uniref:Uncharacterized protein n=2 Tax=Gluconobacter thailandicus TaxID=257438 RepID=A0AAP9ETC9_GLUTH|nr:hypothetical protein AD940_12460 [Gluconobacter thailandicus]QEH96749.1 hypothetical protein FXF46_10880 [Gluconobacter thailandicus]
MFGAIMMMTFLAMLIGVTGAVFLYLAAPAQHLLKCRLSNRNCALSGTGLLCLSLLFHLMIYGSGTAVFALLTLLMIVWSLLPIGLALLKQGHKAP